MANPEQVVVRMEDPAVKSNPDLSYGKNSLSVSAACDDEEYPQRLTVVVDVELPEATVSRRLNQDLLSACRIVGEASRYLKDREDFFKEQILIRLRTRRCKQEPGFLTGSLAAHDQKDWSWKDYAIKQAAILIRHQEKCSAKRALVLATAQANGAYAKAPAKTTDAKDRIVVEGVKTNGA